MERGKVGGGLVGERGGEAREEGVGGPGAGGEGTEKRKRE